MAGLIFKTFTRFMAAAALLLGAQLASADVTGKWAFSVDIMGQTGVAQVTLQQDDAKLSGHYSGQLGETDFDGAANGNDIEFVLVGGQGNVTYKGTLQDDGTIKGTVDLAGMAGGTFTARKSG